MSKSEFPEISFSFYELEWHTQNFYVTVIYFKNFIKCLVFRSYDVTKKQLVQMFTENISPEKKAAIIRAIN